jgi:hypothetical protein
VVGTSATNIKRSPSGSISSSFNRQENPTIIDGVMVAGSFPKSKRSSRRCIIPRHRYQIDDSRGQFLQVEDIRVFVDRRNCPHIRNVTNERLDRMPTGESLKRYVILECQPRHENLNPDRPKSTIDRSHGNKESRCNRVDLESMLESYSPA